VSLIGCEQNVKKMLHRSGIWDCGLRIADLKRLAEFTELVAKIIVKIIAMMPISLPVSASESNKNTGDKS
jgi:hypothetical protein